MFDEEGAADQSLPQSVVQIQKREKITAWGSYGEAPTNKKAAATKKGSKSAPQVLITAYSRGQSFIQGNSFSPFFMDPIVAHVTDMFCYL